MAVGWLKSQKLTLKKGERDISDQISAIRKRERKKYKSERVEECKSARGGGIICPLEARGRGGAGDAEERRMKNKPRREESTQDQLMAPRSLHHGPQTALASGPFGCAQGRRDDKTATPRPRHRLRAWGNRRRRKERGFLTSRTPFEMTGCPDEEELGEDPKTQIQNRYVGQPAEKKRKRDFSLRGLRSK